MGNDKQIICSITHGYEGMFTRNWCSVYTWGLQCGHIWYPRLISIYWNIQGCHHVVVRANRWSIDKVSVEDLPQVCGYEYQMEATTVFKDTEVIIQFTEDHIVVLQKYGGGSWNIFIWDEPIRSVRI